MESFHLIAKEKRIDFQLQTNTDKIYTWVDRDKFEKIFFNLLSNAFKYTPNGKKVTVNMITGSEQVTISVSDEGIGIAPEKQQSLFYRFETLAQYNILQPSSGIGLSLVRELIELHHGNIQVKSEPGSGSEFIVTLPKEEKAFADDQQAEFILSDSDNNSPTIQATEEDSDSTSFKAAYAENENKTDAEDEKTSILIVEDNNELRHFLWNILSETYTVLEATNGKEGLKIATECAPDIVVSDIMMPVMNGIVMCQKLKTDIRTSHIPVILLTAKDSITDKEEGYQAGADSYLTKPFSASLLQSRISNLLTQRRLLSERFAIRPEKPQRQSMEEKRAIITESMNKLDKEFLDKITHIITESLSAAENVDITVLSNALCMSSSTLYRKVKALTGMSTNEYIRKIKMQLAEKYLLEGKYTISEIAFKVGINSNVYFRQCFKEEFGMSASEYLKQLTGASIEDTTNEKEG